MNILIYHTNTFSNQTAGFPMKDVDKELTNEKEEHFCDDIGCI